LVGLLRRSDVLAAYWSAQAPPEDDAALPDIAQGVTLDQPQNPL
jgi:hypothetical protein